MSKYFKTLERLRADPSASTPQSLQRAEGLERLPASPLHTVSDTALQTASVQGETSDLLDGLRLVPPSESGRCVVMAGVSSDQAARSVLHGLEQQAEQVPVNLVTGELQHSQGSRKLALRSVPAGAGLHTEVGPWSVSHEGALPIDLDSATLAEDLMKQIQGLGANADLALLLGPPLSRSVDAALLARATSGLVLVAEPLVTERSDLFLALNRAQSSGCSVLGTVSVGTRHSLPAWIQKLFASISG